MYFLFQAVAPSKVIFLPENFSVSPKINRDLVAGEGFVFAVEVYSSFSHTASTAVIQLCQVQFIE